MLRNLVLIACLATCNATIEWRGITAKIKDRHLLRGVGGCAKAGRLHAIMGPSGSGKTSLLSALSGTCDRKLKLSGDLRADGVAVDKVEGAYVRQQDVFYPYLTVRETLTFAATLRLGQTDVPKVVDSILTQTGLSKAADTIVGDDKIRGVSGGERKRLAIACELVDDPDVLFLDEPTSGLDSFAAQRVVKSLRSLCDAGKTVVCVIHQPSGAVFAAFDDLTLLSEGELMYHGPTSDLDKRLRKEGFPRPRNAAPAEQAVETVSVDYVSPKTEASSREILAKLAAAAKKAERPLAEARSDSPKKGKTRGPRRRPLAELRLLYQRARRDVSRAKAATAIKAAQQVLTALIYGGIYNLDSSQGSIQDRFGLLSLCVIGSTNLAIASTIRAFPKEKTIVLRERSPRSGRPMYGALPYLFSKVAAELPLSVGLSCLFGGILYPLAKLGKTMKKFRMFLGLTTLNSVAASALGLLVGAVAPSTDAALALFPPIIVLMIIFNGSNISDESTPKAIKFLPKLSLVRWGFEGLAVNEFEGLEFKPFTQLGRPSLKTGADALARLSFEDSTIKRTTVAQGAILGACYLQTYRVLKNARPRYATLKRAVAVDESIFWTADAEARLQKIPGFVRGRVKGYAEKYARERGITTITDEVFIAAKPKK